MTADWKSNTEYRPFTLCFLTAQMKHTEINSLSEPLQRERIGLAAKVLVQGVIEDLMVGCDACEQGHRRPEFQIVGIAKDFADRAALHEVHKPGTLPQSRPK